jgi:hypothetical protein
MLLPPAPAASTPSSCPPQPLAPNARGTDRHARSARRGAGAAGRGHVGINQGRGQGHLPSSLANGSAAAEW